MHTVRLILEGVILFSIVPVHGKPDQLWLLLLDPGYKTVVHHQARLYVDPTLPDPAGRPLDGADAKGDWYFDLTGDHLTFTLSRPSTPSSIEFIKNTRPAGAQKPCPNPCTTAEFWHQRSDIHWTNALAEILANVPLKAGHTVVDRAELRPDVLASGYSTDGLILARLVLEAGKVRSRTLWGERSEGNPLPGAVSTYSFEKPGGACQLPRSIAVTNTAVIELETDGAITFLARSLVDATDNGRTIVLQKGTGTLTLKLSSVGRSIMSGDFDAFYSLLRYKDSFEYLPLPVACVGPDSGGACSPATPKPAP